MCLNLYCRSSSSFPSCFPQPAMSPFTEPCSFAKSKIVLAFSTVARIFFSFRTIPESSINAPMSRSDSRATFSGEKSRNAVRKWGHFFSIIRQFKPALKIALDIRSRYPWSSFGGTAFHPGMELRPCSLYLCLPSWRSSPPPSEGRHSRHLPPPSRDSSDFAFHRKVDRVGSEPPALQSQSDLNPTSNRLSVIDRSPVSYFEDENSQEILLNVEDYAIVPDSKAIIRGAHEPLDKSMGIVREFSDLVEDPAGECSIELPQLANGRFGPDDLEGHQKPSSSFSC